MENSQAFLKLLSKHQLLTNICKVEPPYLEKNSQGKKSHTGFCRTRPRIGSFLGEHPANKNKDGWKWKRQPWWWVNTWKLTFRCSLAVFLVPSLKGSLVCLEFSLDFPATYKLCYSFVITDFTRNFPLLYCHFHVSLTEAMRIRSAVALASRKTSTVTNAFTELASTWCNGTIWYSKISRFCNFDMFGNFVKNSNSMCDAALSMWLLFSLFRHFHCKTMTRLDRARTQRTRWPESLYRLWKFI